ncbi:MAG: hypothetical protein B6242_02015 [Anaerolineaceae bacterium 4572_78]|nr:MAG: hypothetical protein B6242_02015 [Anaerolineaceae bacterium 4572_78]
MSKLKSIASVFGVVTLFLVLLMLTIGLPKSTPALTPTATNLISDVKTNPTPSPTIVEVATQNVSTNMDDIVATVNGNVISHEGWQRATSLDMVMNALTNQAPPTTEETLDRLINEILLLQAKSPNKTFSESDVSKRLDDLQNAWNINEATIINALHDVRLSWTDLENRILRLLIVENVMQQLSNDVDLNQWLVATRATAEIGLYYPVTHHAEITASELLSIESELPSDLAMAPYPDSIAPDFTLNNLAGDNITLSNLRGKPTIINFWASWCPPCKQEMPAIQRAYNIYGEQVNFLAINVKESADTVQGFVNKQQLTFSVLHDSDGNIGNGIYQVRGIPTTLFVDERGVVVNRHVGPLDEEAIIAYVEPLLKKELAIIETEEPSSPPESTTVIKNPAHDFTLPDDEGNLFHLAEALQKGTVVLVFYRGHG